MSGNIPSKLPIDLSRIHPCLTRSVSLVCPNELEELLYSMTRLLSFTSSLSFGSVGLPLEDTMMREITKGEGEDDVDDLLT